MAINTFITYFGRVAVDHAEIAVPLWSSNMYFLQHDFGHHIHMHLCTTNKIWTLTCL